MNDEAMQQQRKARVRRSGMRRSGMGTGTTSLLMIFTVLCFATLAMLSLSTAVSGQRIQDRGTQQSQSLAAVKGQVAESVAMIDEELVRLRQSYRARPSKITSAYADAAAHVAEGFGWLALEEEGFFSLTLAVDEKSILVTTIRITELDEDARYEVISQQTAPAEGWQSEDGGTLWVPG